MDSKVLIELEKGNEKQELLVPLPDSPKPQSNSVIAYVKWLFYIIIPTFGLRGQQNKTPLRRTAYLDGLRGFAALMVYWTHHELWAHDTRPDGLTGRMFEMGFGFAGHYKFVALPFIRVFFSGGHYAVATFFVISGYALASHPLALIHAGDDARLCEALSSAMFRRGIRLFVPLLIVTSGYILTLWVFDVQTWPPRAPTLYLEFMMLFRELRDMTYIFKPTQTYWLSYNVFAWSVPVEFIGSMVLYVVLQSISRFTSGMRLMTYFTLAFYFLYIVDGWSLSAFMSGAALCDLDLLAASDSVPRFVARWQPSWKWTFYVVAVFSLYLGGMPYHAPVIEELRSQFGWYYLSFLVPSVTKDYKWFFMVWAGVGTVLVTPRIPSWKALFESRFCQYLGRISFCFYLIHGPVLWTLGNRIYVAVGFAREVHESELYGWLNEFPLPKSGPMGLDIAFLATQLILLPFTLWIAEFLTKILDEPCVSGARRLYKWMSRPLNSPLPLN